jgi:hypothetical protein
MIPPLISICVPTYERFHDLILSAEHNECYSSDLCEVVISLDGGWDWAAYTAWAKHQAGRMRIRIIVDYDHPNKWRPPCISINNAISHSLAPFILVKSPETVVLNPASNIAEMIRGQGRKRYYLTGQVCHRQPSEILTGDISKALYDAVPTSPPVCLPTKGNGLLIMRRADAIQIGGYDESRQRYGRDDDCIRARLKEYGCEHVHEETLRAVHIWRETRPKHDGNYEPLRSLEEVQQQVWQPRRARIIHDWARE